MCCAIKMFILLLLLLLLLLVIVVQDCNCFTQIKYPKCCDIDNISMDSNNSDIATQLNCSEINQNARLQFTTNQRNFSQLCVDIDDNQFKLFEIDDFSLIERTTISTNPIPKCCPLHYSYNTTTRSCQYSGNLPDLFNGYYLKIGLLNCKIINDLIMEQTITIALLNDLQRIYGSDRYCVDSDRLSNQVRILRVCEVDYGVCRRQRCLIKCCPDGQSFVNGSNCRDTFVHGLELGNFRKVIDGIDEPFVIVHGHRKPLYRLTLPLVFHIDRNGIFSMKETDNKTNYYQVDDEEYCIEYFEKNRLKGWSFFRPFPKQPITDDKFYYTRWAMIISVVFLTLTIIYYCCTKQKNTLFGKTLICYSVCCLILFVILAYTSFVVQIKTKICVVIGFILMYMSFCCFTWMNIMCLDIYWTLGSSKSFSSLQTKGKELKRFLLYSLYGWGFPILLTLPPLIFYHIDVLPDEIRVIIGKNKCYFQRDNYSQLVFSTIPIALSQICNTALFIKTIIYCMKVKGEIVRMNDSNVLKNEKKRNLSKYTDRLMLLIKLFVIMGTSFLFEVVSMAYNFRQNSITEYIELIWDLFNSLDGLLIFIIFVCKKRVFKNIQKKLPLKLRKFSLISSGLTQSTLVIGPQNNDKN